MNQILFELLAEDLHELKGSEIKAIIAIYTEGRFLTTREMMDITGMARKTCLSVMESPNVRTALDRVQNNPSGSVSKNLLQQIRRELLKLESISDYQTPIATR